MNYFPYEQLYNFAPIATSMLGYTEDAKAKMKARQLNPENHFMFRRTHTA